MQKALDFTITKKALNFVSYTANFYLIVSYNALPVFDFDKLYYKEISKYYLILLLA